MLTKLLTILPRLGSDEVPVEHQPAEFAPDAMQFKPMVPLRPPSANNDDVMQQVCAEVEKALQASGHLR